MQVVHHQIDGTAMCIAHVTLVGVLAHVEVEAGVTVVVKRTEGHVAYRTEAKPLSNSLVGECYEFSRSVSVILDIEVFSFSGFVDELGAFPLGDEDARGGRKILLDNELAQLVVERGLGTGIVAIVSLVHLLVLTAPTGQQAVKDVGGHEAEDARNVTLADEAALYSFGLER